MAALVAVAVAVIIILIGIIRITLRAERRERAFDRRAGTLYRFDDLAVTRTRILWRGGSHDLAGVRARVESTGAVALRRRGHGRFDDRAVHLIIEGPGVSITRTLRVHANGPVQTQARGFASALNSQAMLAEHPRDALPG